MGWQSSLGHAKNIFWCLTNNIHMKLCDGQKNYPIMLLSTGIQCFDPEHCCDPQQTYTVDTSVPNSSYRQFFSQTSKNWHFSVENPVKKQKISHLYRHEAHPDQQKNFPGGNVQQRCFVRKLAKNGMIYCIYIADMSIRQKKFNIGIFGRNVV